VARPKLLLFPPSSPKTGQPKLSKAEGDAATAQAAQAPNLQASLSFWTTLCLKPWSLWLFLAPCPIVLNASDFGSTTVQAPQAFSLSQVTVYLVLLRWWGYAQLLCLPPSQAVSMLPLAPLPSYQSPTLSCLPTAFLACRLPIADPAE